LVQCTLHDFDPTVASVNVQLVRRVPHSQCWVSAFLDVSLRSTEAANQEASQSVLGSFKIVSRVHWPEDIVIRYLLIKSGDEPLKSVFADNAENVRFRNLPHRMRFLSWMFARYIPSLKLVNFLISIESAP
jgi:hypothetical protein